MIDKNILNKSGFVKEWIESNVRYFKLLYPHAKEEDLRNILIDIVRSHINNPRAVIVNDYNDDAEVSTDLLTIWDWKKSAKPICAGNGTFFRNQDQASSPIEDVIVGRIGARKTYQKTRDTYEDNKNGYEYQYFDMMQKEAKIKINAIYGSFGAVTFQLYNIYTAAATTGTAQSLISTTAISFEAFLSDNAKFRSIDEFIVYIDYILQEDRKIPIDDVPIIIDREKVFNRLWEHFLWEKEKTDSHKDIIKEVLKNCTPEQLTMIYYKNNLYEFSNTPIVQSMLRNIFHKTTEFRNPNKTPDVIADDLKLLWDYMSEFVFYNHAYTERINRLVNYRRQSVIIIDTDSNMINIEPWVMYLKGCIWDSSDSLMNDEDKLYASVNTLAYLVTQMVRSLLDKYCKDCNILPRYHSRINMKNEYYYGKMLLADVKKRYAALTRLQEGKQIRRGDKQELDVKGYDFRKAGVNEEISSKLYSILLDDIMRPEEINISTILSKMDYIEHEIRESLRHGERTYLLRMNCKTPMAYSEPESMGAVQSVDLWNVMYPFNEISVPDKLDVVLLKEVKEQEWITVANKYPDEVERVVKYIFHGPNGKRYQEKGLKYLALPNNGEPIPEIILPFIDVDRIITRNTGTFEPVLTALGLPFMSASSSSNYRYFGSVLDI